MSSTGSRIQPAREDPTPITLPPQKRSAEETLRLLRELPGRGEIPKFSRHSQRRVLEVAVIVMPNEDVCGTWAAVRLERARIGRPIGPEDAWIAATAPSVPSPPVTQNGPDCGGISGLEVLSAA